MVGTDLARNIHRKQLLLGLAVLVGLSVLAASFVAGYAPTAPAPTEPPDAVVEKFYDRISEARIRGGTLLIRQAYRLIDAERSELSEGRFIQIIQKYPSGFAVKIVKTEIADSAAEVTIDYRVPSIFEGGTTVRNIVHLNVDQATNSWKIDFTGETDGQDRKEMTRSK